jgi:hypothetical protein
MIADAESTRAGAVDGAGRSAEVTSIVARLLFIQKSAPDNGRTVGPSRNTSTDGCGSPMDCGTVGPSWNGVFVHGAWLNAHGTL